jgi:hypothetical protein
MREGTCTFTRERSVYAWLRPAFGDDDCLFVYETSSGRGGYVTFDGDAHRLRSAVERLRLSKCEARLFDAGAVLWLSETSVCAERVRELRSLSGCSIYMIYTKRPEDVCRWHQHQPAEEEEAQMDSAQQPGQQPRP